MVVYLLAPSLEYTTSSTFKDPFLTSADPGFKVNRGSSGLKPFFVV